MIKNILLLAASAAIICSTQSCSVFNKKKDITTTQTSNDETSSDNALREKYGSDKVSTMPVKVEVMRLDSVSVMQLNGMWTLRSINGVTLSVDKGDSEDNRPYINFDSRTGKFYANDGCNTINGNFRASQDKKLQLDLVLSTMMLCPDAKYEQQFKTGLANAVSFKRENVDNDNILTLYNDKGSVIMTLVRPETDFLNGSWKVVAINGKSVSSDKVNMVIDIPEEKVHGNAGCNIFNGKIFVDPDKKGSIQFQELIVTRMMCPDIETETAFLIALESVETARSVNGEAQLLDSKNNAVITLAPLKLNN